MPMSNYLKHIRAKVGQEVLLLPSVTAITFDEAGRILLVKHSNGEVWVAPGGSIEPNETPASAVVREMWEETGLWVAPTCLIGMYSGPEFEVTYANGDPVIYVMSVFACQIIGGHLSPDHMETLEIGFFVEHELAWLPLPAWARIVLPDAFRHPERALFAPATWQPPSQG